MTPARCTAALLLAALALCAAGCEIVADFDRSKIPVPADDAGLPDAAVDRDAAPPPGDAATDEDAGDDDAGG